MPEVDDASPLRHLRLQYIVCASANALQDGEHGSERGNSKEAERGHFRAIRRTPSGERASFFFGRTVLSLHRHWRMEQ